ncbi:MAG: DUF1294 domain-containing protein [Burkholderiaceae bacterium]|jgi:uncharacterized membrane protein YsdA (DUF1294 family)|nr:DUF1294 domain-containing protein [Burkholderiaceae bacterium]
MRKQGTIRRHRDASAAPAAGSGLFKILLAAWVALMGFGLWQGDMAPLLAVGVLLLNLITFLVYRHDKKAAETGRWRISERTLHLLSLAGGWPAAWFAQQALRHKSSKREFRVVYWITVIGNLVLLGILILLPESGGGMSALLRSLR